MSIVTIYDECGISITMIMVKDNYDTYCGIEDLLGTDNEYIFDYNDCYVIECEFGEVMPLGSNVPIILENVQSDCDTNRSVFRGHDFSH